MVPRLADVSTPAVQPSDSFGRVENINQTIYTAEDHHHLVIRGLLPSFTVTSSKLNSFLPP